MVLFLSGFESPKLPLRPESGAIPCRHGTSIEGNSLKSRLTFTHIRTLLVSFEIHALSAHSRPRLLTSAPLGLRVEHPISSALSTLKGASVPEPNQSGLSDNAAGGLAYVTFIPAIIFLVIEPFNKNSYVRFHSWQSIFLSIAWVAVDVILRIIGRLPFLGLINLFLWPVVGLLFFILWLVVMINAFNGKRFKLPLIGNLAEKQAGA
jgi:uncharacterized membrane protein